MMILPDVVLIAAAGCGAAMAIARQQVDKWVDDDDDDNDDDGDYYDYNPIEVWTGGDY